jgi:hypothetical protein
MQNKPKRWITVSCQFATAITLVVACSAATDTDSPGSAGSTSVAGSGVGGQSPTAGTASATAGTPSATGGMAPATGGMSGSSPGGSGGSSSGGGGSSGAPAAAGTGGMVTGGAPTGGTASGGASGGGSGGSGGGAGGSPGTCPGGATATPCPPTEPNSIAYIGCSMADNIGQGYAQVGGKTMWTNSGYGTGAKVVENWGPNGDGWNLFNTKLNAIGGKEKVKAIMVQICILSTRSEANVKAMIQAARDRLNPGTHVYLVGQPGYEAGHDCFLAGAGGAKWTDDTARKLAMDPSVNQNLTYLGQFKLDSSKGEAQDGCHASGAGFTALGNQAKAFWGG